MPVRLIKALLLGLFALNRNVKAQEVLAPSAASARPDPIGDATSGQPHGRVCLQ
jgi:hypothetical protein